MKFGRNPLHIHTLGYMFFAGVFCGEKWYWQSSWRNYPIFQTLKYSRGFSVGPFLFWMEG